MRSPAPSSREGRFEWRASPSSDRLERAEPPGEHEVDPHHDHRDSRERGGKWDVGLADLVVDDVADEARARTAYEERRDEVAEREREREDRACDQPGQRER